MPLTAAPNPTDLIGYDLTLMADPGADTYTIHQVLDERLGPRSGSRYLWSRHPDGRLVVRTSYPVDGAHPVSKVCSGDKVLVRTRVNITRKTRESERRAWPLHDKRPRRAWLERRGIDHGFVPEAVGIMTSRETITRKDRSFWIDATEFCGWLIVNDADRFNRMLTGGLSARRAWGFGLVELLGVKTGSTSEKVGQ
jgi:hypothetical protein